ncbi:MAG: HAD family hydrolase [Acidobacteriaceae bacterium]|nr:HAD family hydrolase [Acidobacteriaceae bacterium]
MARQIRPARPAFLFDLDGTLIDTVYQHILAWSEAVEAAGIQVSKWRIHRRIGMSDGLILRALERETGTRITEKQKRQMSKVHGERFRERWSAVRPVPGARELLDRLTEMRVPWCIATSAHAENVGRSLEILGLKKNIPVVTRDEVKHAKPDPDVFLAAAAKINANIEHCFVVGDSPWDLYGAQRARALSIGVLTGGFGVDDLTRAGAYRVFEDTADLLEHLDEVAVRPGG